jgi:hypothetical protein
MSEIGGNENMKSKIELINGAEGLSLYIDDFRICGPKPWGGGTVIASWDIDLKELENIVQKKIK